TQVRASTGAPRARDDVVVREPALHRSILSESLDSRSELRAPERHPRCRPHLVAGGADLHADSRRTGGGRRQGRAPGARRRGAGQPGYDPLMQAFTGIVSVTGEPDRPGVRVGTSLIDLGTGVWAALGILAALHERAETGRGREVDVALFETGLSLVGYQLTEAFRTGSVPGRHGTAFPLIAPYEVFPTK